MLSANGAQPYEPTADDRLWLSRAVSAEGAPYDGVARALVNLFMLQRSKGNRQTLATLVRAYAQPVNPRWFENGDLFLAHARTPLEVAQARARKDVHSKRAVFGAKVIAAVTRALSEPYSGATDYAVPSLDATKKGYTALTVPTPGQNRLWTRDTSWAGYTTAGASVATLLLLAGAAYLLWKGIA